MGIFDNLFGGPAASPQPAATAAPAPAPTPARPVPQAPAPSLAADDPFPALVEGVLGREGRYTNDPNDSGGETNWGITASIARAFGYTGAMRDMSRAQAVEIYRQRFWLQPRFDQVHASDPALAARLLDIGVNCGPGTAGKFLQRALNVLGDNGKYYGHLTVDGGIGAVTIQALRLFYSARGADGRAVLLSMVVAQQSVYYIECAENRSANEDFEFGWQLNRALMSSAPSAQPTGNAK